jgi:hypothetical protein
MTPPISVDASQQFNRSIKWSNDGYFDRLGPEMAILLNNEALELC